MAREKEARINEEITAPQIRLVGIEGEPIGVMEVGQALAKAEEAEIDLVEIAPNAAPPVCRLMDYGKFKYNEQKKKQDAKAKQKQIQVKEIKFRPGTDEGDYKIKLRNLIKFLTDGDKTKVTLRFRGREMAHQNLGAKLLQRVEGDLEDHGQVEQFPKMEGRQMVMVVAPLKPEEKVKRQKMKAAALESEKLEKSL